MWLVQGENMPQREQGGCQGKYGMSGYPRILMEGGGGCQWWWRRWLAIPSRPSNSWLDPHTWLNGDIWSNISWCCGQLFNFNINNIETLLTEIHEGWGFKSIQFNSKALFAIRRWRHSCFYVLWQVKKKTFYSYDKDVEMTAQQETGEVLRVVWRAGCGVAST